MSEKLSKIQWLKLEPKLIIQAKKDRNAFAPLYDRYYLEIFGFIQKRVNDYDVSGDIASQVFLKAMINLPRYKQQGFPFSSWLYRISINEVNSYFRKQKRAITVELAEHHTKKLSEELSFEFDNNDELLNKLLKTMSELPLEHSQLLEFRFFDNLSFKEMGEILGVEEAAAKMRTYRVLKKLKVVLED